jgi:hypothetical protein
VEAVASIGEDGAGLVGVVADRDDVIEGLFQEGIEGIGVLAADVDAVLGQDLDGQGIEYTGLGAGAVGLEPAGPETVQEALRYLAAGGVMGADEEDPGLVRRMRPFLPGS